MSYSIANIIGWSKMSQALAAVGEAMKAAFTGGTIDEDWHIKLYVERKSLEWEYAQDSSSTLLFSLGNYVLSLCGAYLIKAQYVSGDGGVVVEPTTPSALTGSTLNWIEVRKADFANATEYVDTRLRGKELSIIGNWLGSRIIDEGTEWEAINGGGVRILTDGFDSTVFNDDDVIIRIDIGGAISEGVDQTTYTYDLTATTEITGLDAGTSYQIRTVIIKPNGYDYTWASTYIFPDNWPEQPSANGVDTKQIYLFMYVAGVGDVCWGQSLNIPL